MIDSPGAAAPLLGPVWTGETKPTPEALAELLESERRAGKGPHCPILNALHYASGAAAIAEMKR